MNVTTIKNAARESDKYLSNMIIFYYIGFACNLFFKMCFRKESITMIGNVFYIAWGIVLCYMLPTLLKKSAKVFIGIEMLFSFLYFSSILQNNAKFEVIIHYAMWTLVICIPILSAIYSIVDKSLLFNELKKYSKILILICTLILFINFGLGFNQVTDYSLPVSCLNLLPIFVLWEDLWKKFNWIDFIFVSIGLISVLLWGGRRVILMIACYLFCKCFFHLRYTKKRVTFICLCCVMCLIFGGILSHFINTANSYTSIRILDKLIQGKFLQMNSRLELYFNSLEQIMKKPILGWGLCGGWQSAGEYPHNCFLEIWQALGVVWGTVVIALLIIIILNALKTKQTEEKSLLIIYLSLSSPLLLSGPILNDIPFWILLALCISRTNRKQVNNVECFNTGCFYDQET